MICERTAQTMKAYRAKNSGLYVLEVPSSNKQEIAKAMAYRGMAFSTTGSTREVSTLFCGNPYSLCDIATIDDPDLGTFRKQIELSRAKDGIGTKRLPPGKELWGYQRGTLDYLIKRNGGIDADEPGLGKAQPMDEPILTPEGWRKHGDILPGDMVVGPDGAALRVSAIFDVENTQCLQVTFSDGRKVRCNPDHLWEVERRGGHGFRTEVISTKAMVDWGLTMAKKKPMSRFYVPLVDAIRFPSRDFNIDPYVLGVLIGDGALTGEKIAFSTPDTDIEIAQRIENILLPNFHLNANRHPPCPQYYIQKVQKTPSFRHYVEFLGLAVKSPERFIPPGYFLGSITQRYDLLRGLMDTDGSCIRNRTNFHTMSACLAEDIAQLVRSLGGWAKVRAYDRSREEKGVEYQVNIKTADCPFYLRRKAAQWRPCAIKLAVKAIEPVGICPQRCIKVENPRGLYVTVGYTLTHNTPTSIAFCNHFEAQRVLVICPASVRIQWEKRVKEWSTIAGLTTSCMLKVKDGIHPTANYQIISYDAARNPAILKAIGHKRWDVLICDEAHKMKNREAITTRAILGNAQGMFVHGKDKLPCVASFCDRSVALTGTPLLNRPSECYVLFRHFDWESIEFMSEEDFKEKYNKQALLKTIEGKRFKLESTSLELELQNRLRVNIMARHEKHDVFDQMKVPRYQIVSCEADGKVSEALGVEGMLGLSIEEVQTTKDFTILGHISEARRLMGEALAPQVAGYVADLLDGGERKYVLFGWHLSVLAIYERELAEYGTVLLHGGKSPRARQKAIDDFISDPNIRVFIANIQAGGEGVDGLQHVASRCGLGEPDWVPSRNEQAISRVDRIGQLFQVMAEVFVAPGSISEKILVKSLEKMNVIHRVLDEKEKIL